MPRASVKRLIECDKNQLIDLVLDIEKYPTFVPYCIDAKIYKIKNTKDFINIIADLTIGKGPFKDTYKSDVKFNKKDNCIYVTNIDGPLKHLNNKWTFKDNKEGDCGGRLEEGTTEPQYHKHYVKSVVDFQAFQLYFFLKCFARSVCVCFGLRIFFKRSRTHKSFTKVVEG